MTLPDKPVQFLSENILTIGAIATSSGVKKAKLEHEGGNRYKLVAGDDFDIYWCHYKPDETHYVTLGSAADLMFTPRMDGCSFGVGIPNPDDHAVTVAHANTRENPTTAKLQQIEDALASDALSMQETQQLMTLRRQAVMEEQKQKLGTVITELDGYLSTTMYQNAELTTFGVRDKIKGKWSFYFQARIGSSNLLGCFPLPGRVRSVKT